MVKIHFEIMSKYEQKGEPVSVAVPFPKGKADYGDLPLFTVQKGRGNLPGSVQGDR